MNASAQKLGTMLTVSCELKVWSFGWVKLCVTVPAVPCAAGAVKAWTP
jgi:hypothetical protein